MKKDEVVEVVKIINAFNAGDSEYKFCTLLYESLEINKTVSQDLFDKLSKQFRTIGSDEFLKLSATKRQQELLIHNGSIWSFRNMFNVLNSLIHQKELDPAFYWIKPEEPKLKDGDWVTDGINIRQLTDNYMSWLNKSYVLWIPKDGDFVIPDSGIDDDMFVVYKYKDKGSILPHRCEPFFGKVPKKYT